TVVAAMAARQDLADMQVYMTTKWVECPEDTPLPHDLQILTDPQLQVLIRALGQKKGIDLLNGPSVTCKLGQLATVEVVRELVRPGSAMDWVGTRTEVTTLFHQGKLLLSLHPELGLPMKNGQRVKGSFDPDKSITVQHLSRRESVAIDDGHTVALYIGSPEPGRKVVFFVTAALIAPSGARVDIKELRRQQELGDSVKIAPPQAAAPSPAPEGKVRVRTHIFRGKTADALAKVFPGLKPESQVPPEPKSPILPTPNYTAAPMPFTLEGILTDPQLKTLLAAAQTKQDLSIDVWPEAVIPTGKDTTLPNQSGHELHVTPVLGPDGNTVDLTISILKFPPDRRTSVQTSVTIWDGQTVILGGDTEMICLTVDKVK
ncbi:MAG: hypothetical protein KDK97_05440, partial [Verrucomicrobiales bacterium]|nr:hypothetical protein [Verrucomicrobiales bacterium]